VLITHTHTSDGDEEPTAEQEQIIQDLINEANIEGAAGPIDAMIQAFISKVLGDAFHAMQGSRCHKIMILNLLTFED
jgi:hypothetical protein